MTELAHRLTVPLPRNASGVLKALAWPPIIIAAFIVGFTTLLPGRYRTLPEPARLPSWILMGVLVAVSVAGNASPRLRRAGMVATVALIASSTALVVLAALGLVARVIFEAAEVRGVPLLSTSIGVWIANVIVFALWYWLLDRGGPYARRTNEQPKGDLMFPQDSAPDAFPGWTPHFIDYLFVAFNTSTAFSPTETFPITSRGKVLMLAQASLSLTTLVVVAARAVNILG